MTAQPHSIIHATRNAIDRMSLTADPIAFRTSMIHVLAELADAAGFGATVLVCLDPENWSVDRMFGQQSENEIARIQTFIAELRKQKEHFSDLVLCSSRDAPPTVCDGTNVPIGPLPTVIAVISRPRDRSALMLIGEYRADYPHPACDAPSLWLVNELLSYTIERHRLSIEVDSLQRRLDEAKRREAAGPLANAVAHELNNNMTAIMGYAEMASETALQDSALHDYIEEVLDAGRKAQRILERVLKANLVPDDMATSFCIEDALVEILPALRLDLKSTLRLDIGLSVSDLLAVGNPADFQQVLLHLCRLAASADSEGGAIKVAISPLDQPSGVALSHSRLSPGRYVQISLTRPEPTSDLFSAKGPGGFPTGSAFATAYEAVVTLLDGALHVSGDPAVETHLDLFLPRAHEQSVLANNRSELGTSHLGNGERVAIIDSDPLSRSTWEDRLALLGFEPLGFQSEATLAAWSAYHHSPDVILAMGDRSRTSVETSDARTSESVREEWIYIEGSDPENVAKPTEGFAEMSPLDSRPGRGQN